MKTRCAVAIALLVGLFPAGVGAVVADQRPEPAPFDYCAQMGQARDLVAASLVRPWFDTHRGEALAMLDDLLREC